MKIQEQKSCNFCGRVDYNTVWSEGRYEAIKCRECGIIRLNLECLTEESKDIYCESYFRNWYLKYEKERKDYFRERLKNIEKLLGVEEKIKLPKLLDIGCGVGFFLEIAREKGWVVYGAESSKFASSYIRDKLNLDVFTEDFTKADLPGSYFDVITMWDVAAHLVQPADYIKKARELLRQDGLLVIKTPEHPLRMFRLANFISLFVKSRSLLHIPAQIYHFTPEGLSGILERLGFNILKVEIVKEAIRTGGARSGFKGFLISLSGIVLKLMGIRESFIIYAKRRE